MVRFTGAGAACDLLSIHPGEIEARQFDMVSAGNSGAVAFVKAFVATGTPLAR